MAKVEAISNWRPFASRLARLLFLLSLIFTAFLAFCYWSRPDSCAAVTVLPAWVWMFPGLALILPAARSFRRSVVFVAAVWVAFTLAFGDEPRSLARSITPVRDSGKAFRVVTLNCAGGSIEAAHEVKSIDPDIVLLQESPSKEEVERLAREMFGEQGGVVWGVDASIIAKGEIEPLPLESGISIFAVIAKVRLESGPTLWVTSLRLIPPLTDMDLWNADCWRDHKKNRTLRRAQIEELMTVIDSLPTDQPLIVGGDLNAPPGDGAFSPFSPLLRDSWMEAGRGRGSTIINDFPVLRIDQVWVNKHLRARSARVQKTKHSDHRMVIFDLAHSD